MDNIYNELKINVQKSKMSLVVKKKAFPINILMFEPMCTTEMINFNFLASIFFFICSREVQHAKNIWEYTFSGLLLDSCQNDLLARQDYYQINGM